MDFFKSIEGLSRATENSSKAEFSGFFDTGSYVLNGLVSGTLFGGVQNNKVTGFQGESQTGKTFFTLAIVRQFLKADPKALCFYFDTEAAVTNQMMQNQGIPIKRVIKGEPDTIEKFRTRALKTLDAYLKQDIDSRPPILFVLDSLGMLSTEKEMNDTMEGKNVRDMTKAQAIRGTFRVLRQKLGEACCPMLVTNHIYEVVGAYVPTKKGSGGHGFVYAADNILTLTKKIEKDEATKDATAALITVMTEKSRLSREKQKVTVRVSYDAGLDRYFGLFDMGVDAGLIVKQGNRYAFPDGRVEYRKTVEEHPEDFFTPEFLKQLDDEYVAKTFRYTMNIDSEEEPIVLDDVLEEEAPKKRKATPRGFGRHDED
jgi:RecA/RadA recombinase